MYLHGARPLSFPPIFPRCTPPATTSSLPIPTPSSRRAPSHGRVIVIAPTRAACETIELALGLTDVDTVLEREHGEELREWALGGEGFGIVAGTGTGKTLGIRPIAESILGEPLRVGVVNREREATPETPTWNVVIVTTGIARRWFQDDLIAHRDTVVVDEIHQTSAELELCLALGKRAGCRFIWLCATVDPAFYARYLDSANVLETEAFDPALRARVKVVSEAGRGVPRRALPAARDPAKARRRGVRADPRRGGAAGGRPRRALARAQRGVLPRRRADPRHPAVPRGRARRSRSCWR